MLAILLMALMEERGADRRLAETPRGSLLAYTLTPTIYVTIVSGHMETEHADALLAFSEARVRGRRGQKLRVFHDWVEMTGYESQCRQRLTSWAVANLDAFDEMHIAQRSKLVAMGVQVANLALGGLITPYTDRTAVEIALRRAVDGRASMRP